MKIKTNKYIIFLSSLTVIFLFVYSFIFFPTGYVGTTKKDGVNLGCICHGSNPTIGVSVFITGPDSVAIGQTVVYRVRVAHGPAIKGGFNAASQFGAINVISGDTTIRKQDGELTQTFAKPFTNDTVSWSFNYTAPNTAMIDTLFATGNSTNNDTASENDQWNWSANKNIRAYSPIGIINISTIAKDYSLSQNYPNPFNPVTTIRFAIPSNVKSRQGGTSSQTSNIKLVIFDILGREVATLVNQQLKPGTYEVEWNGSSYASGIYYYRIETENYVDLKKMIMVK